MKTILKRGIAVCMMSVMSFMLPATPVYQSVESVSRAAKVKSDATYISETKLFIKKGGNAGDAKAWCESQGDGWQVLDGDLNAGASGAFAKDTGVFLCYRTTTDPEEAITDFAVMNEKGSYSEGEYERLLKEQKEQYIDMVGNMKSMLTEYRENYKNQVPMAVNAHDFLNAYIDDDSNELMGDLLLTVEDDKLAEILLQTNGVVLLTIQQMLASACDTGKNTWIDRMVKLGSYDKLKTAFGKNMKSGNVVKTLEKQYKDKAQIIYDNWDDIRTRIDGMTGFIDEYGLADISEEKYNKWLESVSLEKKEFVSFAEFTTLVALCGYEYDGKTLFNFFAKTKEEINKEGIEILYPMAASLTKGQLSALDESVGLFGLVQDAFGAKVVNDKEESFWERLFPKDKPAEEEDKTALDETVKNVGDMIKEYANGEKTSIYDGVDRDIYGGGVAVTTKAQSTSEGSEKSWTGAFYKNGEPTKLMIGMGVGAAGTAALAVVFGLMSHYQWINNLEYMAMTPKWSAAAEATGGIGAGSYMDKIQKVLGKDAYSVVRKYNSYTEIVKVSKQAGEEGEAAANALKIMHEKAANAPRQGLYNGLKWGFTVFTVLLAAADIAITAYFLYKYYNVEHTPIPHHMVDLSYGENKESAYVAYMSVRDQDGNSGDLNGGDCKQWLALYYTKDEKAGTPILAPNEGTGLVVKTGNDSLPDSSYSPLHMFGTPNVAQNLTFADGDNGWSYNDKNNGTYLFFTHANAQMSYSDPTAKTASSEINATTAQGSDTAEAKDAGTALSTGVIILIGAAGLVAGIFIGAITTNVRRKKRHAEK